MPALALIGVVAALAQPAPAPGPEPEPPPPGLDTDLAVLPLPAPPPEPAWRTRLEVGGSGSAGVSETLNLRLGVRSWYAHPLRRITLDAAWWLSTASGDRFVNKAWGNVLAEFPRPDSRWIHFAQARYDFDEQRDWDQRVTAGVGAGYQLVDLDGPEHDGRRNDVLDLVGRFGIGLRQEFDSADDDLAPEGIAGLVLAWQLSRTQRISMEVTAYPDLEEPDDVRVMLGAQWTVDLDTLEGLSLEIGAFWEYESQPGAGFSPNELLVHASLAYEF